MGLFHKTLADAKEELVNEKYLRAEAILSKHITDTSKGIPTFQRFLKDMDETLNSYMSYVAKAERACREKDQALAQNMINEAMKELKYIEETFMELIAEKGFLRGLK